MLLQPKKTKFKRYKKGIIKKLEYKGTGLKFGSFGLKARQSGVITARQLEATRQAITRKLKRAGKVWLRIFPDIPVTAKPLEVRMGKGKGNVSHWVCKVGGGTVLFEIDGVSKKAAQVAFRTGSAKLPVKTSMID